MVKLRNAIVGVTAIVGISYLIWSNVGGQFWFSIVIVLAGALALWGLHKVLPHPDDMAD